MDSSGPHAEKRAKDGSLILDGPFGQNISLSVAREPNVGGDPAKGDKFSTGVKVTKEMYF